MQIGPTNNAAVQSIREMGDLLKDMAAKQTNFEKKMLSASVAGQVQTQEVRSKAQMLDVLA